MTQSAGLLTHQRWNHSVSTHPSFTSSSRTLSCPLHHLLSSFLSLVPSIPHSTSSFTSLPNPLSSSWIPPFLHTPPFPRPYQHPLSPLLPPFSQLVCLCAATQPISAHPAGAGSLTQPLWRTWQREILSIQTDTLLSNAEWQGRPGCSFKQNIQILSLSFLRICMDMHSFAMCKGTRTAEPWFQRERGKK